MKLPVTALIEAYVHAVYNQCPASGLRWRVINVVLCARPLRVINGRAARTPPLVRGATSHAAASTGGGHSPGCQAPRSVGFGSENSKQRRNREPR